MKEEKRIGARLLFFWTWETTYNGAAAGAVNCATTNGDICSRSASSPVYDPGEAGTGHVTIISVNGVPCQNTNNQELCEGEGGQGATVAIRLGSFPSPQDRFFWHLVC